MTHGRLAELFELNGGQPASSLRLPKRPQGAISENRGHVAVAVAAGRYDYQITFEDEGATGESVGDHISGLAEAYGLLDPVLRLHRNDDALRRVLTRCLFTSGLVVPDTDKPAGFVNSEHGLTPEHIILAGLLTHGLDYSQITLATGYAERAIIAKLKGEIVPALNDGEGIPPPYGRWIVSEAFCQYVLDPSTPDRIMPTDYVATGVNMLIQTGQLVGLGPRAEG